MFQLKLCCGLNLHLCFCCNLIDQASHPSSYKFVYFTGNDDSSVDIATRYGLDDPGTNRDRGEIFRTRPDRLWGSPRLLYKGYRVSFPAVRRPGHGVNYTTFSAEVK